MKTRINPVFVNEPIQNEPIQERMKRVDDLMNYIIWGDKKEFYETNKKENEVQF